MNVSLTNSSLYAMKEGIETGFQEGVNIYLNQNEYDTISGSEDINEQTEAMVDLAENSVEKRIPEKKVRTCK